MNFAGKTMTMVTMGALLLLTLSGCARSGSLTPVGPAVVIDFYARYAGTINDAFHYFIPIDADGDNGADGPLPVAAGPYWQNGWGTGSFTHYIEYSQGQYAVYQTVRQPTLVSAGGGLTAVTGTVPGSVPGTSVVTVQTVQIGSVAVSGTGMVQSAANATFQSAGTLALQTDVAGRTVAGSLVYTPAATGGRALTASEQAVIDVLNVGGIALQENSLSALGLSLALGAPQASTQTLTISPTTAAVRDVFTPVAGIVGGGSDTAGVLTANTVNAPSSTLLAGATITTGDFVAGGAASVSLAFSPNGIYLGTPFAYTLPAVGGGTELRATVDLAMLGTDIPNLSVNFISVTELIFDPTITDPALHCYDGLGRLGNGYKTFSTTQFQTITNASSSFDQEKANDVTLQGNVTQQQRNQVDLIDWSITIRSLR
ncbi:MAG: hypothetical protein WCP21_17770 [Armatimonadota bacterium]